MLNKFFFGLIFIAQTLLLSANSTEVSVTSERLREIINAALSGDDIGRPSGLYPLAEPKEFGDVVIRYININDKTVYLVTDNLPTKKMFVVAPIRLDIPSISKARNIPELIKALSPAQRGLKIQEFVPAFENLSQTILQMGDRVPCALEGNVVTLMGGQAVLFTYIGDIAAGSGPLELRPLLFGSAIVRYVSGDTLW